MFSSMTKTIWTSRHTDLCDALAEQCWVKEDAIVIAREARVDLARVTLSDNAANNWQAIVRAAGDQDLLIGLIERARIRWPSNPVLLSWHDALKEGRSVPPLQSESRPVRRPDLYGEEADATDEVQMKKLRDELFGLRPHVPAVKIVLSRLEILPAGTMAVGDQDVNVGYSGPAINYVEYEGARALEDVLRGELADGTPSTVSVEVSPLYEKKEMDAFKKLLDSEKRKKLRDKVRLLQYIAGEVPADNVWDVLKLETQSKIMPGLFEGPKANLILLGNQIYNLYAQLYRTDFQFSFEKVLTKEGSHRGLKCVPNKEKAQEIAGPERLKSWEIPCRHPASARERKPSFEVGVVDRFEDHACDIVVMICAGTGSRATKGCALWLARHWQQFNETLQYVSPNHEVQRFPLFFRIDFRDEESYGKESPKFYDNYDDGYLGDNDRDVDDFVELFTL